MTDTVLHRDLKPSNVLIDPFDQARVTDFGLAKNLTVDSQLTETGHVLGAPSFIPPEQARGQKAAVGPHSDVYSLGAMLYHLITGRPPFVAETLHATLDQLLNNEPASPRSLNPTIPCDLETICLKCLEKEPSRRYQTAKEMAEELGRFRRGEPIKAKPLDSLDIWFRWCKRNAALSAAISISLLLLVSGAIVSTWEAIRAKKAQKAEINLRKSTEGMLDRSKIQHADELFASDPFFSGINTPHAIALLTSVLKSDPSNRLASERLMAALASRSWILPKTELPTPRNRVRLAKFSPDSCSVLTLSSNSVQIWDSATGHLQIPPILMDQEIEFAEFSPDGLHVITISNDAVWVWKTASGELLAKVSDLGPVFALALSSGDGASVRCLSRTSTAHLDDVNVYHYGWTELNGFASYKYRSPAGLRLATISSNTVTVLDPFSNQATFKQLQHTGEVQSAQFSPDTERLLTVSSNKLQVWDIPSGKAIREPLIFEGLVHYVQFSPNGRMIFVLFENEGGPTLAVINLDTGTRLPEPFPHCWDYVITADFSPDGMRIATGSLGLSARIWDSQTGAPLIDSIRFPCGLYGVESVHFTRDGSRLQTSGTTFVGVWDSRTGKKLVEPLHSEDSIKYVDVSRDGLKLLTVTDVVRISDIQVGKSIAEPLRHTNEVEHARFSPDSLRILTDSAGKAEIWDVATGKPLGKPIPESMDGVTRTDFTPDGKGVLVISSNLFQVWDVQTGKVRNSPLPHQNDETRFAFSPNGTQLLSFSNNIARI